MSSSPAAAAWAACSAPPTALYHRLGLELAEEGIGTVRVGYRKPNDLARCVHDVAAATDLASRSGGRRFVVIGHSFGGAVAIQSRGRPRRALRAASSRSPTQSAGCELAAELGDTPLLLLHGTDDEILPPDTSAVVQILAGHGDVVLLPGAGHLLTQAADEVHDRVHTFITTNLR